MDQLGVSQLAEFFKLPLFLHHGAVGFQLMKGEQEFRPVYQIIYKMTILLPHSKSELNTLPTAWCRNGHSRCVVSATSGARAKPAI